MSKSIPSFIHAVATLVTGTVASQIIGILAIPIIAWLYSPAAFGEFTTLWVIASSASILITLRYERAIVLVVSDNSARIVSTLAYLFVILFSLFIAVLLLGFGHLLPWGISTIPKSHLAAFCALCLLFSAYQIQSQWLIRNKLFRRIAIADLSGILSVTIFQSCFALSGWNTTGALLSGALLGRLIQLAVMRVRLRESFSFSALRNRRRLQALAWRFRNFPLYSAPYSLLAVSVSRALIIIASIFQTPETVGFIAMAHRLTYLPVTSVANALRRVYVTRLTEGLGKHRFTSETLIVFRFTALMVIPFFVVAGVLLPWVLDNFFPSSWHGTGKYIFLLFPGAAALFLGSWFDRIYEVTGQQRTALLMELISSIVIIGLYWYMFQAGFSTVYAVGVFGLMIAAYNILWIIKSWQIAGFPIVTYTVETGLICVSVVFLHLTWWFHTKGVMNIAGFIVILTTSLAFFLVHAKRLLTSYTSFRHASIKQV